MFKKVIQLYICMYLLERKGYSPQYSGLENSMACIVHQVAESDRTERRSLSQTCIYSTSIIFFSFRLLHNVEQSSLCYRLGSCWLKLKVLVAQSCLTPCDPMDWSPPGSSVHGILQARILEWVATSFSRGSSQPRD